MKRAHAYGAHAIVWTTSSGKSDAIQRLKEQIYQAAHSASTVLIEERPAAARSWDRPRDRLAASATRPISGAGKLFGHPGRADEAGVLRLRNGRVYWGGKKGKGGPLELANKGSSS